MNAEAISKKFSGPSLIIGVVCVVIAFVGMYMGIEAKDPRNLISYLIGMAFWLSILIGMLFLTMIWHTFDAGWSVVVRRQLEHFIGGFKFLGILFLPLLIIPFLDDKYQVLWKWMKESYVAGDVIYEAKAIYLDETWFVIRAVIYFAVWIALAESFRRFSFSTVIKMVIGYGPRVVAV